MIMSSKDVTKVKVSHWFMEIAAGKIVLMWSVVILADPPNVLCRMPVQCSSLYHSLFVVLLLYAGQHMHVQSFHLFPGPITVGLNTSIECCRRMWQSQLSSIKKKTYGFVFGKEFYTKCLVFFSLLNLRYPQILNCVSFVSI